MAGDQHLEVVDENGAGFEVHALDDVINLAPALTPQIVPGLLKPGYLALFQKMKAL